MQYDYRRPFGFSEEQFDKFLPSPKMPSGKEIIGDTPPSTPPRNAKRLSAGEVGKVGEPAIQAASNNIPDPKKVPEIPPSVIGRNISSIDIDEDGFEDALQVDDATFKQAKQAAPEVDHFEDAHEIDDATLKQAKQAAPQTPIVTAKKVSVVTRGVFQRIGDFFSRIGQTIKSWFIAKPITKKEKLEKKVQKHMADLAVHLAEVKGYGHLSTFKKRVINPIVKPILRAVLNDDVLPHALSKAKDLLQNKLFGPGKSRVLVNEVEQKGLEKLGKDIELISKNYPTDKKLTPVQVEGQVIKALHDQKNLHSAVYPITENELQILSQRYDIIRRYYPKVKDLESLEARLNNPALTNQEKADLTKDILKARVEVNRDNYATWAVLAKLRATKSDKKLSIVARKQIEKDILVLEEICEDKNGVKCLEKRIFDHEKKYIRHISEKVLQLVYPDGVPTKFSLPVRIANLFGAGINTEEVLLDLVDNMVFNAIDNLSQPGMLYSLLNDNLIKPMKEADIKEIEAAKLAAAKPSAAPMLAAKPPIDQVVVSPAITALFDQLIQIAAPKLATVFLPVQKVAVATLGSISVDQQVAKEVKSSVGSAWETIKWVTANGVAAVTGLSYDTAASFGGLIGSAGNKVAEIAGVAGNVGFQVVHVPHLIQDQVNVQKETLIKKLETSGDDLIEFGMEMAESAMFPNDGLRAFRPGSSNEQVAQQRAEFEGNLGYFIEKIPTSFGQNQGKGAASLIVDRFSMQMVNKHMIYGLLDQAIEVLEV